MEDGTWVARVFGDTEPITLLQSPDGPVYSLKLTTPNIWSIAIFIRNQPGVKAMAKIDPFTDTKITRAYDEYRYMTFPF